MLDAAKAMKLSAKDLLELNIIDEVIPEPLGGAHRDRDLILRNISNTISQNLDLFKGMTADEILNHRKNKFLQIGRSKGFVSNPESLSAVQTKGFNFQEIKKFKKIIIFVTGAILVLSIIALSL